MLTFILGFFNQYILFDEGLEITQTPSFGTMYTSHFVPKDLDGKGVQCHRFDTGTRTTHTRCRW